MAFETKKFGSLELLTAPSICVPHGFTTRLGGVSAGSLASLNLGLHRGDDPSKVAENYRRLTGALGIDPEKLVMTWQIHSNLVRQVDGQDPKGLDHRSYAQCDALITNTPGLALWVFTADCTPILFHDPVTGAVGAAHAGWRGTAAGIGYTTVQAMVDAFGCNAADIRCAIGPSIGPCCFETDDDVPRAMLDALGDEAASFIRPRGEKYHVDLKQINALWLRRAGAEQIEICTDCTACQTDRFWSHRRHGDGRGSQGAIIQCKEAPL